MTNYSHYSGGLLYCSASLLMVDEILMHVVCSFVLMSVRRRGCCDAWPRQSSILRWRYIASYLTTDLSTDSVYVRYRYDDA